MEAFDFEPEYRRRIRKKIEEKQQKAETELHKAADAAKHFEIIRSIDLIFQENKRYNNEKRSRKKGDRFWNIASAIGLWLAAGVGLTAILVSTRDADRQRTVMQGELNEMRGEQRPWISVVVDPASDLSITENLVSLDLGFKMNNTGKTPASFAWPEKKVIPNIVGTRPGSIAIPEWCDNMKINEIASSTPVLGGVAIFPGEIVNLTETINIERSSIEYYKPYTDQSPHMIGPLVAGCVRYKSIIGGEWHQTGFIYTIGYVSSQSTRVKAIAVNNGIIPLQNLRLVPWTEDGGRGFFAN
jgi:hypothetical protein